MRVPGVFAALALGSTPAFAASGPFFSMANTDFVVTIAFLIFVGVLLYFKVPRLLAGMLDKRANDIRAELDEARALREDAKNILAEYERKHREVSEQAEKIVENAKAEAERAAEQAKEDIEISIERRLRAAQEQIASAHASAVKEVRDSAVSVAVAAASDVIAKGMSAKDAGDLIDRAINDVGKKLH